MRVRGCGVIFGPGDAGDIARSGVVRGRGRPGRATGFGARLLFSVSVISLAVALWA